MFNTQLRDYVKVYEGFYSKDFCNAVVDNLKTVNWELHSFYNALSGTISHDKNELSVSYDVISNKKEVDEKIWHVINRYVTQDMIHAKDWFNSWNGYRLSRFHKYEPNTRMRPHCDHIHSLFDGARKGIPILSILGVLNEDYEGGEFVMCGEEIKLGTGDVIVFPSSFLYPHEVKLVTSGTRYSFVSWVW